MRTGEDRSGQVRTGQDRSGQVRKGQDRSGQIRIGQDRLGQVRIGQDRLDQVRTGLYWSVHDRTWQIMVRHNTRSRKPLPNKFALTSSYSAYNCKIHV